MIFPNGTKTLIFAICMIAAPAWSDAVKLFVVQDSGGIVERPGSIALDAAEAALGEAPDGATGVVMEPRKPPRWTSVPASDVHAEYGGEGDHMVELFPQDGGDPVEPIEIFPEGDVSGAIKPGAGNWIGRLVSQSIDNCPPETGEVVAAQLLAIDGAAVQPSINEEFSPPQRTPEFTWVRTSPNRWVGEFVQEGISRVDWTMEVLSPDRIQTKQTVQFSGLGEGVCTSQTNVDYLRQ